MKQAVIAARQLTATYLDAYLWLLLVSSLDAMLTWLVLSRGGAELNPIADRILVAGGFGAMVAFKFIIVTLVIGACEVIARRDVAAGARLARLAVAISAIPVAWTIPQLYLAALGV